MKKCVSIIWLILYFGAMCTCMATTKTYRFQLLQNPEAGMISHGTSYKTTSLASCVISCMNTYNTSCKSLLYHDVTKTCTPGSWVNMTLTPPSPYEGSLYVRQQAFNCSSNDGFLLYTQGNTSTCLGRFDTWVDFNTADTSCLGKGGFLTSVKTLDKLEILRILRGTDDVWVGLDDVVKEGEFVWKEDGTIMTNEQRNLLFPSTEPSGNAIRDEDCVEIKSTNLLNDELCNKTLPWVCEVK